LSNVCPSSIREDRGQVSGVVWAVQRDVPITASEGSSNTVNFCLSLQQTSTPVPEFQSSEVMVTMALMVRAHTQNNEPLNHQVLNRRRAWSCGILLPADKHNLDALLPEVRFKNVEVFRKSRLHPYYRVDSLNEPVPVEPV
jgi:hypothetical protein